MTVIMREDSVSDLSIRVRAIKKIDYDRPETLLSAYRDQDVLIIMLGCPHPQALRRN